jgi:hypothetical protein
VCVRAYSYSACVSECVCVRGVAVISDALSLSLCDKYAIIDRATGTAKKSAFSLTRRWVPFWGRLAQRELVHDDTLLPHGRLNVGCPLLPHGRLKGVLSLCVSASPCSMFT